MSYKFIRHFRIVLFYLISFLIIFLLECFVFFSNFSQKPGNIVMKYFFFQKIISTIQNFPPKKTKHCSKDTIFGNKNLFEIIFQTIISTMLAALSNHSRVM